MSRATASEVIRQTAGAGVREFCRCGGARNAVLLSVLAHSRGLRLWRFPQERCAGSSPLAAPAPSTARWLW